MDDLYVTGRKFQTRLTCEIFLCFVAKCENFLNQVGKIFAETRVYHANQWQSINDFFRDNVKNGQHTSLYSLLKFYVIGISVERERMNMSCLPTRGLS